jgi:hypothetical protein
MMVFATIGAVGLYLLFAWLLSAVAAAWLADRKGYGERVGLTFGLLLSAVGLLIVLVLPGRPGSKWRLDGPIPPRRARVTEMGPPAAELESAPAPEPPAPAAEPPAPEAEL